MRHIIALFLVGTVLHLVVPSMAEAARSGRHTSRPSVNRNVNVNRSANVNVNRHVNVDVDRHWHPVATAAAVTATAAVTAAVVGSMASSVPPSCVATVINGVTYQQCGSTWY
jgi:hypothetical protein